MSYEPTVVQKALARLERRRDSAERRRFERERELYAKEPRLRQLDAALRGTMADLARLAAGASSSGKEQVIFSKRDRARLGKQVVLGANEILAQKNAGALPGSIGESKMGAFINKIVGVGAQLTLFRVF